MAEFVVRIKEDGSYLVVEMIPDGDFEPEKFEGTCRSKDAATRFSSKTKARIACREAGLIPFEVEIEPFTQ